MCNLCTAKTGHFYAHICLYELPTLASTNVLATAGVVVSGAAAAAAGVVAAARRVSSRVHGTAATVPRFILMTVAPLRTWQKQGKKAISQNASRHISLYHIIASRQSIIYIYIVFIYIYMYI